MAAFRSRPALIASRFPNSGIPFARAAEPHRCQSSMALRSRASILCSMALRSRASSCHRDPPRRRTYATRSRDTRRAERNPGIFWMPFTLHSDMVSRKALAAGSGREHAASPAAQSKWQRTPENRKLTTRNFLSTFREDFAFDVYGASSQRFAVQLSARQSQPKTSRSEQPLAAGADTP